MFTVRLKTHIFIDMKTQLQHINNLQRWSSPTAAVERLSTYSNIECSFNGKGDIELGFYCS